MEVAANVSRIYEDEEYNEDCQKAICVEKYVLPYADPTQLPTLLRAVVQANLSEVKHIIESGEYINVQDIHGNGLLHVAVIVNNIEILQYLLAQKDTMVDVRNFEKETPLYLATVLGRLDLTKKLIQAGANVNLPNHGDTTPLHMSLFRPDIAHFLILHGAHVDAIDSRGNRPLHHAAEKGCLETVCMLLYYNADANVFDCDNFTPFMKAIKSKNIDIQGVLFEYVDDFNTRASNKGTILALALAYNSPYVEDIIKRGADVNYIKLIDDDISEAFFLCIETPNPKNFKLVWERLRFNESNKIKLKYIFRLSKGHAEKYLEIIIESDNFELIVKSFRRCKHYFLCIYKFSRKHLKLEQLTSLTCRLLQYGYIANVNDIHAIFDNYGYCDLFKILLYMDNDLNGWKPDMIVSRLIFDLDFQLNNMLSGVHDIIEIDLTRLLKYVIFPPLIEALLVRFRDESLSNILARIPRVPSLIQLSRDVTRKHIRYSFNTTNTCQFYTIINHLDISSAYKKILTFETKLYNTNSW